MKVYIVQGKGEVYGVYYSRLSANRKLTKVRRNIDLTGSHESYRVTVTMKVVAQ